MKRYYDPEYDRIVDESVPRKQYEWFSSQKWFHNTYEEFLSANFLNEDMSEITGSDLGKQNLNANTKE